VAMDPRSVSQTLLSVTKAWRKCRRLHVSFSRRHKRIDREMRRRWNTLLFGFVIYYEMVSVYSIEFFFVGFVTYPSAYICESPVVENRPVDLVSYSSGPSLPR
jgi:hypothetical protein